MPLRSMSVVSISIEEGEEAGPSSVKESIEERNFSVLEKISVEEKPISDPMRKPVWWDNILQCARRVLSFCALCIPTTESCRRRRSVSNAFTQVSNFFEEHQESNAPFTSDPDFKIFHSDEIDKTRRKDSKNILPYLLVAPGFKKKTTVKSKYHIFDNEFIRCNIRPIEIISRGSCSKVYLLLNIRTRKLLAMKYQNTEAKSKERSLNEIKALQIVQGNDLFTKYLGFHIQSTRRFKEYYIFMEYYPSANLTAFTNIYKVTITVARFIIYQTAKGLIFLHKNNILHCDINPTNILVNSSVKIRIADFGSCSMGKKSKNFKGTIQYMAPEVYRQNFVTTIKRKTYGNSVDFYSLGVTMYELYYGYTPTEYFRLIAQENKHLIADFIHQTRMLGLIMYPHAIDSQALNLMTKLLEKDPNIRISGEPVLKHSYLDYPYLKEMMNSGAEVEKRQPVDSRFKPYEIE